MPFRLVGVPLRPSRPLSEDLPLRPAAQVPPGPPEHLGQGGGDAVTPGVRDLGVQLQFHAV